MCRIYSHTTLLLLRSRILVATIRSTTRWLSGEAAAKKRGRPRKTSLPEESAGAPVTVKPQVKSFFDEVDLLMKEQKVASETTAPRRKRKEEASFEISQPAFTSSLHSTGKSLFDIFKVPEAAPIRSPTAFEAIACDHYQDMLNEIMSNDKKFRRQHTAKPIPDSLAHPVVAWLQSEEPTISQDLPSFREALHQGVQPLEPSSKHNRCDAFVDETAQQRKRFVQAMGWDKQQFKMAQGTLMQLSNMCAKKANGRPVEVIWEKIKESGIVDKKILHGVLYASATFSTGSNRRKRAKYGRLAGLDVLDTEPRVHGHADDQEELEDLVDVTDEIAIYHDLLHNPTEQSINIRVRLLVSQDNAKAAERLVNDQSEEDIRLRVYTPILRLYLEQGDVTSALQLYKRMRSMPLVHFDADTYVHLIAKLAAKGLFCSSAALVQGARALGYASASGPGLFDELAAEMAEEVIEIPSSSAQRLHNAFAEGFQETGIDSSKVLSLLKSSAEPAVEDEVIASRVSIDSTTGNCPRSGSTLRLIGLEINDREKLRQSVCSLARTSQVNFEEKTDFPRERRTKVRADDMLDEFYRALDERIGEPFTVVIDGPNVGYYMQNYDNGRFNYDQIKSVVDSLESVGERPLVILPRKYTYNSFFVNVGNVGSKQALTHDEIDIRDDLIKSGKVYVVPPGLLDDYYWILATISNQTVSRQGRDLYVPPGDDAGRWPGTRPLIITNDQMVDHKLEMMEPMLFRRWYSNYIVNYNISALVQHDKSASLELSFSNADFFSREIQGNACSDGSLAWHFPLSDMDENDWFCVRIPADAKT